MRHLLTYGLQFVVIAALWILFVYQVSTAELLAALIASAITVVALRAASQAVPFHFKPKWEWLLQAWRIPGMIAQDLWIMLRVVGLTLTRRQPLPCFELAKVAAPGDTAQSSAQRALATLYLSISPNSIVLDIDRNTGMVFFHQLVRTPLPALLSKLKN